MKQVDTVIQAKREQEMLRQFERLIRIWRRRDGYEFQSKQWQKYDKRANNWIERISKKLVRYRMYAPDWYIQLYREMMAEEM